VQFTEKYIAILLHLYICGSQKFSLFFFSVIADGFYPGSHKTWFYYRDFPVGSAIPLLYNPYKPAHVRLVEPRSRFAEPIDFGMMVFGLALLVPTLWLFVTFLVAF
jgi:hypothetical protein